MILPFVYNSNTYNVYIDEPYYLSDQRVEYPGLYYTPNSLDIECTALSGNSCRVCPFASRLSPKGHGICLDYFFHVACQHYPELAV